MNISWPATCRCGSVIARRLADRAVFFNTSTSYYNKHTHFGASSLDGFCRTCVHPCTFIMQARTERYSILLEDGLAGLNHQVIDVPPLTGRGCQPDLGEITAVFFALVFDGRDDDGLAVDLRAEKGTGGRTGNAAGAEQFRCIDAVQAERLAGHPGIEAKIDVDGAGVAVVYRTHDGVVMVLHAFYVELRGHGFSSLDAAAAAGIRTAAESIYRDRRIPRARRCPRSGRCRRPGILNPPGRRRPARASASGFG